MLVMDDGGPPFILVLYCMPPDEGEWFDVCGDHHIGKGHTILKYCGYWISIRGWKKSDNTGTINIRIPLEHVFNASSLEQIMETIQNGGEL